MRLNNQSIRKFVFWLSDTLKGSPVKKHLTEVEYLLRNKDRFSTLKTKSVHLEDLLRHAVKFTNFYSTYSECKSLKDFPVTNKNLIREKLEDFISGYISQQDRIPVVTSGSTGTPFKVFHDQNKKYRNNADTIFFAGKVGYEIGQRLIYMKIWARQKMAPAYHYWIQNVVPVDVIQLSNHEIKSLIENIESYSGHQGFLGYVSAMEEVCKYLSRTGKETVNANISSIITMSESLNEYTRLSMEKYFGAPVFSRYSNLENGIIAQQIPGFSPKYLVNTASYHIEILKMDSDDEAKTGELGRIVITDLFNHAMPLIRYDTGDLGAISSETDEYGNTFLDIVEGRKLDVLFDTKGDLVSSYIAYKNMWQYTEINQYQLIQEAEKTYVIKISMEGVFSKEQKLISEFKQYLGQDAEFTIEYVREIPLLDSGKRRKIVNNYRKA